MIDHIRCEFQRLACAAIHDRIDTRVEIQSGKAVFMISDRNMTRIMYVDASSLNPFYPVATIVDELIGEWKT